MDDKRTTKMVFRNKKLDNLLETPFTIIAKWLKIAWSKVVIQWRIPQYTFAIIVILNGIGLFFHVVGYWLSRGDGKTCMECFKYIIEKQLPWNIEAFSFISIVLLWLSIIAIPFIIGISILIKKK